VPFVPGETYYYAYSETDAEWNNDTSTCSNQWSHWNDDASLLVSVIASMEYCGESSREELSAHRIDLSESGHDDGMIFTST